MSHYKTEHGLVGGASVEDAAFGGKKGNDVTGVFFFPTLEGKQEAAPPCVTAKFEGGFV